MVPVPPTTFQILNGTQFLEPLFVEETTVTPDPGHGITFGSFIAHILVPLLIISTFVAGACRWRFRCMSIAQLEEIVSEILSLIRIDGCYHVEFDLLDVLPDMQGVRDDLERLIEGLSFLKQETYEHEPKDTRLWAWLVFRQRQIRTIDKLYWSLRLVHMKILVAIEKEKRRLRLGTGRNQNPNQGTSPYESLAPSKSMLSYLNHTNLMPGIHAL
ncbi:hypothetical protein Moror_2832 [Moniliophthora roreri MCA 2997]|uniref:Uncharacterized protein n=1 Tax=Moniliophthora roreri (strain MCA 2997) TaxID=1381753 RepID=V2XC45_MONRO|nr:hypothetical protein Moror_2832 [Moniliophthora roreri MCA 2997]